MTRPVSAGCILAAAALAAWTRAGEAVDLPPVAPELLRGVNLYAPDLNVSLDAPGPDWEWLASSQETGEGPNRYRAFACRLRGTSTQFLVGVFNPYWHALTAEEAGRFSGGVAASFKKRGWQVAAQSLEPSDVPLPGSYRYQLAATDTSGGKVFLYGYQAAEGRMFTFQHVTTDATEPPRFRSFVRSFRFVGTRPQDPLEGIGHANLAAAVVLTLLAGGVGWVINTLAGRVRVNLWNVAIALLLLLGLALSLWWLPKLVAAVPPGRAAYIFGYSIASPVLWPLVFAVWRSRALARRRTRELLGTA